MKTSENTNMNYQILCEKQIEQAASLPRKPSLLLHACCAPCSSYVLEYLNNHFDITLFFYNPNISPKEEYLHRSEELKRLVKEMPLQNSVDVIVCDYSPEDFFAVSKGRENDAEGGSRCFDCYKARLLKTLQYAVDNEYDYYSTTLSISPHKNAAVINDIGSSISKNTGVKWLYSDFKKKNGYIRSIQLSKQYNLYRQNYCGCIFSKNNS